jgi:hypothetical protein
MRAKLSTSHQKKTNLLGSNASMRCALIDKPALGPQSAPATAHRGLATTTAATVVLSASVERSLGQIQPAAGARPVTPANVR